MHSEKIKKRALIVTLCISLLLCGGKFVAFFLTSSVAILSDALESIINVVAGSFALFSIYIASLPKDRSHPYGHGKIEFLSAGFEGSLILTAGLLIIGKSVYAFFIPTELTALGTGIIISGAAGLINFIMGMYLQHTGKKHQSITLIADGKHLATDAYTSAGLIIGLLLIYFSNIQWIDNVIAFIFGGLILREGVSLLRKSIAGVMDEADARLLAEAISTANACRTPHLIDLHNFRIIQYGFDLHIDCHITVPFYYSLEEAHQHITQFEKNIQQHFTRKTELFTHAEPCKPGSCCRICPIQTCPHRKEVFEKQVPWSLKNVLPNKSHFSA